MRERYGEAELVVLSSREEVSPMSAIEALAAGIPVVTTRAGGAGFVVDDGQTGRVVDVGDAEALARRHPRPAERSRALPGVQRAARDTAESRFRLDRVAQKYLDVYRLAAAQAGA